MLRRSEGLIPTALNHPQSIGTCSIGIQVTRGSHKMAVSVIGDGKRGWTLGVSCCFVVFCPPPSLPLLALSTMPTGTIDALCRDKSIIIIGDAVIGSKQKRRLHCRRMHSDRLTAGNQMLCVFMPPESNISGGISACPAFHSN